MRTRAWICAVMFGVSLSACGGGLKYHIDDATLAGVPAAEQQGVLAAKGEVDQATTESANARAAVGVDDRDVSVAESEYGQAKLEVDKAEAEAKLAEQSKDLNRTQAATAQVKTARLGKQAADAKVDWLKQRRKANRATLEAAERHLLVAQAHLEQEKARLAQQKGIRPSQDFSVLNFDQQVLTAQGKWDQARVEADRQRLSATQAEAKYNSISAQYGQARGAGQPAAGQPAGQPGADGLPAGQPLYQPPGQ